MPPALPIFAPENPVQVLADLANADLSFNQVAALHHTCATALSLWLARHDITDLTAATDSALIQRARRSALSTFPKATLSLNHIIAAHCQLEAAPTDHPTTPNQRRRAREIALKAATLLLRIARFQLLPLVRTPTPPRLSFRDSEGSAPGSTPLSPPRFQAAAPIAPTPLVLEQTDPPLPAPHSTPQPGTPAPHSPGAADDLLSTPDFAQVAALLTDFLAQSSDVHNPGNPPHPCDSS